MTIGVICGLPQEWAYLRSALSGADHEEIAHITSDTGELDAHPVVLAAAGMGKVNTGLVATLLTDRLRCHTIIFTGVAGGLDERLHIGDIIIADNDGAIVVPVQLAPELIKKASEKNEWEEFTRMKLAQGGDMRKYYPLDAEAQAEYEAWRAEGEKG